MDFVGPIIQLLKCASAPIIKCWNNHRDLEENWNKLIRKLETLNSQRSDIESRREPGKTVLLNEVELWLTRVTAIDVEIHNLEENFQNVKCFCRASLGEKVIKKTMQVEDLYGEGKFPNGLVMPIPQHEEVMPIQPHGEDMPTIAIVGGESTFKRKMEEIWAGLIGDEITKIGVYGMGGIGKTTAMEYLNNSLIENTDKFDNVIWITVSKDSDIISLQHKIARKLRLDFSEHEDETARATKIHETFITKKRFVLILDDLWEAYELKNIGIPEPTPQNGCKLVVTTRSLDVCCIMKCEPIQIELLSEGEALKLFLDIVGQDILSIPNIEDIVKDIVHECAGLPLAIVTVAGSLRPCKACDELEIALEELRESTRGSKGIFERLKFSYDRLNDKRLQDCLLYCALFPEDHPIEREVVIEYLIVEGIIEERKNRQSQIKKGQVMLNRLINACLLNETIGYMGQKSLKMHDLIRDMAIEITKANPHFLVKAGMGLKSIPKEQDWKEDLDKVSLMCNSISTIPSSESPKCPKLSTLLLRENPYLSSIHNNFFLSMEELSVLDLSKTRIEKLPDSISNLVKLTALLLSECHYLKYVPSLAKLTTLRELNFYRSGITEAPEGMEMLVQLRYLNFDNCQIETIPDGVLCRLINLEYLFLNRHNTEVNGEELAYLKKLKTFEGALRDGNSFNAYIGSLNVEGPDTYILQVGVSYPGNFSVTPLGYNKNVWLYRIKTDEEWSLLLPNDVQFLAIEHSCISRNSLCELTSFLNVTNLRCFCIDRCEGIKHLLSYSSDSISLLQRLEKLDIEAVPDLQGLIRMGERSSSLLPFGTFSSLKEIRLCGCRKIKKLFRITSLPNLEEIIVFECEQLVEIVSTTTDEDGDQSEEEGRDDTSIEITLPKLKILKMNNLPELKSFCSSKKPVVADSLQSVRVWDCPKLKKIPFLDRELCPPPSLENLGIPEDLWESLEWDHPNAKAVLQPLCATNW